MFGIALVKAHDEGEVWKKVLKDKGRSDMDRKESENADGAIRENVKRVLSGTILKVPSTERDPLYTCTLSGLSLVIAQASIQFSDRHSPISIMI